MRAQGGDQAAFAMLAVEVGPRFHGVVYPILRDVALAEDAVQQGLLHTWQDLPRLRDPARFDELRGLDLGRLSARRPGRVPQ